MRGARWFLLLYTHAAVTASNPRSVNLALKTTFEFNEKKDVAFIKNVRHFLDRIGSNVERKLNTRERAIDYRFTDFLQELISILISYDDRDFKEIFKELYHVVSNQRDGGTELKELISNNLRPVLLEALRRGMSAPPHTQKERLKRFASILSKTDKSHASFVNFLNLLYKGKPSSVFHRILRGFKTLRGRPDGNTNVRKLVRDAVEYLVYEHYTGLDDSVRRDVGKWLRALLKRDASLEYKQSLKSTSTRKTPAKSSRFTFITLYPEAIDLNVKGVRDSSIAPWKKLTVSNRNRFYLVKGKRRMFTGNQSNQEPGGSGWSSLESATTVGNQPTSAHPELSQSNTYPRAKSHHSHWTDVNDKDLVNEKNLTRCNDSISTNYLERIKRLEEQLNEMKSELRARISPITESTSQPAQIRDEYSYMLEDNDPFDTNMRNSSESIEDKEQERKNINETFDYTGEPAQKRFRTAISNKSDTIPLGDGPLSTEIKEFLNTRPRIINFKATNVPDEVTPANDTLTNSTTEPNTVTAEDAGVTEVVTADTNRIIKSQRNDTVNTITAEFVSSTDATKIVKIAKDTTRLGNVDPDISDGGSNRVR